MILIKKILLYLLGGGLLVFGNRKAIEDAFAAAQKNRPPDPNDNIEQYFQRMELQYDEQRDTLINHTPFFETIRVDESKLGAVTGKNAKTTVESDHAETASASS